MRNSENNKKCDISYQNFKNKKQSDIFVAKSKSEIEIEIENIFSK